MSEAIEQLAARVAAGPDPDAERALAERLRPGLVFLCSRRAGPKDAEGLANQVTEAALSKIRRGDWANTRVPALVVAELRLLAGEARLRLSSAEPDTLAVARLAQVLSALSQQSRDAVTRLYVHGESEDAAGEGAEVPIGTIRDICRAATRERGQPR